MDRKLFFAKVRAALFPKGLGALQSERIEAVLDRLLLRAVSLRHAAYILATAHHESDRFKAMEEYASGAAYEGRKDLGNTEPGDGRRFKGRGLVQITGRRNYLYWAKRLDIDLIGSPHLASLLETAVRILIVGMLEGTFTGKRLSDYQSYRDMRRVVNGTDKAAQIAAYADIFEQALRMASYGREAAPKDPPLAAEPERPIDAPRAEAKAPAENLALSKRLWAWLSTAAATVLAFFGDLDPTVQLVLIGVVLVIAVLSIATMPRVRKALWG